MKNKNIPFQTINWSLIGQTEHQGEKGTSFWRTMLFDSLRIRIVEYSPGYIADHWCTKGHIVHCLEGTVHSQLKNKDVHILEQGMTYIVSDEMSSHRSKTISGCKLLIIDGDFLK